MIAASNKQRQVKTEKLTTNNKISNIKQQQTGAKSLDNNTPPAGERERSEGESDPCSQGFR